MTRQPPKSPLSPTRPSSDLPPVFFTAVKRIAPVSLGARRADEFPTWGKSAIPPAPGDPKKRHASVARNRYFLVRSESMVPPASRVLGARGRMAKQANHFIASSKG